jgi:hypothetical protein
MFIPGHMDFETSGTCSPSNGESIVAKSTNLKTFSFALLTLRPFDPLY